MAAVAATLGLLIHVGPAAAEQPVHTDSTVDDLTDLETRFKAVAEKVAPGVVAISASTQADDSPAACRTEEMSSDKLQAFLSKTTRVVGTGFVINSDGYVLTNDHVIDDAEQLWITTDDRKVYPAIVVGSDPRSDLAVLKVPGHHMPTVHFADGAAVRRGQWSIAMGNPYGLSADGGMCVSVGVVSATHRSLPKLSDSENRLYSNLIQTTAQINPGNSGGPLFDLHGDVIGINTAVIMPQKSVNGIGFAVPVDEHFKSIVSRLEKGNEVVYGYLGVVVVNPTDHDRATAGLSQPIGARVETVEPDSPATGKILVNDIVVAVDGAQVADSAAFIRCVGDASVVEPVQIKLFRDGNPVTVSTTLKKRPMPVAAVTRATQRLRWGGMLIGPANSSGKAGVVVYEISPASPFVKQGLHEGAVISTLAGRAVTGMTQLQNLINETPLERCEIGLAAEPAVATANAADDR